MFNNLTNRLSQAFRNISGNNRLTEDNIKKTLREVRTALLEADVAVSVVRTFIDNIKKKAIGHNVEKALTHKQELIKIIHQELIMTMGEKNQSLNLATQPPAVILIVGPQGSGKTTSVSKIGRFLREKNNKKVLVVSTDVYRPAAIKQLDVLSQQAGIDCFQYNLIEQSNPIEIVNTALKEAKLKFYDILLVDTPGCLYTNTEMMNEIQLIHTVINPIETLFIIDAMVGQDAIYSVRKFNEILLITGIVLTKVDGDARGGAALSICYTTGKPIKFFGTGEKTEALELFYPDRIASRILGMGDVLSLIEEIEKKVDHSKIKKMKDKFKRGEDFNLADFLDHMHQMKNLGGISNLISKLPLGQFSDNLQSQIDDKILAKMEAIIYSMTLKERIRPDIINNARKRRIAEGCGMQVKDVNHLLKKFDDIRRTMKKIKQGQIMQAFHRMKNSTSSRFFDL